jgi:prepilin-type N-terminal cleavage/methylation domain-containing protein
MGKNTNRIFRFLNLGYSLVEMMVVLGVIGFIAAIALFNGGTEKRDQLLIAAQKELVSNLRSLQSRADNGYGNVNYKIATFIQGDDQYTIDGTTIDLPVGATISLPAVCSGTPTICNVGYILFTNSRVTTFANPPSSPPPLPAVCGTGSYFACFGKPYPSPTAVKKYDGTSGNNEFTITLAMGSISKTVKIVGDTNTRILSITAD